VFQSARLWIPRAGLAQRLDISLRATRRLDIVERNSFRFFRADRFARSNESTERMLRRDRLAGDYYARLVDEWAACLGHSPDVADELIQSMILTP